MKRAEIAWKAQSQTKKFLFVFRVEIGGHFLIGRGAGDDAPGGQIGLRDPGDGIQGKAAELVILPVFVKMSAGEAESAAAAGIFGNPRDVLPLPFGDGFAQGTR